MRVTRTVAALAAVTLVASGCSDEPELVIETVEVTSGEVVETVAAPATIQPKDRVTVTSPVGGEVAELLVADGDHVGIGTPLLRLASDSVELQIAQAEAAVEAADALGAVTAGVDLSPLVRTVREQLAIVIPDVLAALEEQVATLPEEDQQAALDRLAETEENFAATQDSLRAAESRARAQADAASASQRAAAEAQREQAAVALEAARDLEDELVVLAPVAGVVQLADGDRATGLTVPDLGGAGSSFGGLLGGAGGGASSSGPIAVGVTVGAGQPLVTIFDLTHFHAAVSIDEIDAVEVAVGQPATVLVDAFPDAELPGEVEHVAIEPTRGETGGVVFPVRVALELPSDVDLRLRVGLTASVEIQVARVDAELVVPSSALLRRGGQEVVYLDREGLAVEVDVRVLAIGDDTAAVEGELEAGERVVTVGIEDLADGDPLPVP